MDTIQFSDFDFAAFSTFWGVDIVGLIVGLGKQYRNIDPIPDGSVIIKRNPEIFGTTLTQHLSCYLQSGTKVYNALMYLGAAKNTSIQKAFKVIDVKESTPENQTYAIKCLVASLVIFISRGQLPATQGNNAKTALPRFINNIMKLDLRTEEQLKMAIMDFDPRHVNMDPLFENETNFTGWDEILQNRFALGVAGHKPLKAIQMVWSMLDHNRKEEEGYKVLEALKKAADEATNGFYPSLHPSKQTFSRTYNQFYRNSIKLMFEYMVGNPDERHEKLKALPMFKPDNFVKNELRTFPLSIATWTGEKVYDDLGEVLTFGESKKKEAGHSKLVMSQSKGKQVEEVQEPTSEEEEESKPSVVITYAEPSSSSASTSGSTTPTTSTGDQKHKKKSLKEQKGAYSQEFQ